MYHVVVLLQVIFGTGDRLKAVTLTANSGFVRAAYHQVFVDTSHLACPD